MLLALNCIQVWYRKLQNVLRYFFFKFRFSIQHHIPSRWCCIVTWYKNAFVDFSCFLLHPVILTCYIPSYFNTLFHSFKKEACFYFLWLKGPYSLRLQQDINIFFSYILSLAQYWLWSVTENNLNHVLFWNLHKFCIK